MNRTIVTLVAAATLLVAASCCCCCGSLDWTDWDWEESFQPTLVFETPTPEPAPINTREPVGDAGAETE